LLHVEVTVGWPWSSGNPLCQFRLQPLAAALPDDDVPQLARKLLEELEERRRLILTPRTFAAARRTYEPHEAREDGVIFPAFRRVVSAAELGQHFADLERQQFGRASSARWWPGLRHRAEPGHLRTTTVSSPEVSPFMPSG
jgi:hypothetical protein